MEENAYQGRTLTTYSPVSRLSFHGTGGGLFSIHIRNIFLTILTLGIYFFWGKVNVRKYIHSQLEFKGDRFAFHGTGQELLKGYIKAAVFFGIPIIALSFIQNFAGIKDQSYNKLSNIIFYGIFLFIVAVAKVGARRYRLSRTSWRGIRFSFRGQRIQVLKILIKGTLLTGLTLGFYYPVFQTQLYDYMTSHSYFGNRNFRFIGKGSDLVRSYALIIISVIALIVISLLSGVSRDESQVHGQSAWVPLFFLFSIVFIFLLWLRYSAVKQHYFWDHTCFSSAKFTPAFTVWRLVFLKLGNLLLLIVTLGFGWPWVVVRNARFFSAGLAIEGPLDLASIQQEAQDASATGEALSGFFDLDFDLG